MTPARQITVLRLALSDFVTMVNEDQILVKEEHREMLMGVLRQGNIALDATKPA